MATVPSRMRFVGALVTGLLLFASDHPLRLWWLQFVAFVPFLLALASARAAANGPRATWPLGSILGLGYALPTLAVVGFAPPIVVAAAANVAQWTLLAPLAARLLTRGPTLGACAAAAIVTLVEIVVWYAVPMFGTAQCFVRPLSAAPYVVAFVAFTGVAGLVFVLVAVQALLVNALRGPRRGAALLTAAGLVVAVASLDLVRWTRPLGPEVRVAAGSWGEEVTQAYSAFDAVVVPAMGSGAELLVTPETGMWIGDGRQRQLDRLGALAKQHAMTLAIGVFQAETNDNRIWFIAADGTLRGEYRKTHLVPWLEDYTAGDGTLVEARVGEHALGGMICQDDNFTDVARGYGRLGVRVLAVPTNDWPAIREFHLENGLFRAIENGYAIVRGASNGISALVSPRGEVVQRLDHVTAGGGLVTGPVPVGDGAVTLYARLGDWPMFVLSALLVAFAVLRRRIE